MDASRAVAFDHQNYKAMARKGDCLAALGHFEQAIYAYRCCETSEANDKKIQELKAKLLTTPELQEGGLSFFFFSYHLLCVFVYA